MQKAGFIKRVVIPVGIILLITGITSVIYEHSWKFKDNEILYFLSSFTNVLLFLSIFFSVFFIYPISFFKGAGLKERTMASFIPLLVWMIKEIIRMKTVFSVGESLYFGLNPLFIFLILVTVFQMGISDFLCRVLLKKRSKEPVKIFPKPTVVLLLGSLISLFLFLAFILKFGIFYFNTYGKIFS